MSRDNSNHQTIHIKYTNRCNGVRKQLRSDAQISKHVNRTQKRKQNDEAEKIERWI
jgi:hypothetical protein